MSVDKEITAFDSGWSKMPNLVIDAISGSMLSPNAVLVVLTVIRYTQGMGGRKSAQIPIETFKRVLGKNRNNTVFKIVDEAVQSGLIHAKKKRGVVTTYSVNDDPNQWRKEPLAENATGAECNKSDGANSNTSSGEKRKEVVAENATLIKSGKDSFKETPKEDDSFIDDFETAYQEIKNHLMIGGIIPIGEKVNDDFLKPEAYKFETWFKEKSRSKIGKSRSVITWFSKFSLEERKRFYTDPNAVNRNYYDPAMDNPKGKAMSQDEAERIRNKYKSEFGL